MFQKFVVIDDAAAEQEPTIFANAPCSATAASHIEGMTGHSQFGRSQLHPESSTARL
jgi:hypothetical protein